MVRLFRLKGAVLNRNPPNFDDWKAAIVAGSAADRKPVAPVLVCIDAFDGGTVIPVSWQTGYVDAVKAFGGPMTRWSTVRPAPGRSAACRSTDTHVAGGLGRAVR